MLILPVILHGKRHPRRWRRHQLVRSHGMQVRVHFCRLLTEFAKVERPASGGYAFFLRLLLGRKESSTREFSKFLRYDSTRGLWSAACTHGFPFSRFELANLPDWGTADAPLFILPTCRTPHKTLIRLLPFYVIVIQRWVCHAITSCLFWTMLKHVGSCGRLSCVSYCLSVSPSRITAEL